MENQFQEKMGIKYFPLEFKLYTKYVTSKRFVLKVKLRYSSTKSFSQEIEAIVKNRFFFTDSMFY